MRTGDSTVVKIRNLLHFFRSELFGIKKVLIRGGLEQIGKTLIKFFCIASPLCRGIINSISRGTAVIWNRGDSKDQQRGQGFFQFIVHDQAP